MLNKNYKEESDTPFDPTSTTVTNDEPWYDNHGNIIETGRGGKISFFDGYYYWIGSQPHSQWNQGGDVFLYRSKTLGSNSWTFVRKVYENQGRGETTANCQIHKHPVLNTYVIHCKGRNFLVSTNGLDGEFQKVIPKPRDPSYLVREGWNWGANSAFLDDDGSMYMVASRKKSPESRTSFIYRLRSDWLDFHETDPIVVQFPWRNREALSLLKTDGWYYLLASGTRGWRPSPTRWKRSRTIVGLKDAKESEVVMHSGDDDFDSMGCQFRFLMEIEKGKWIFGGSRHPDEDPTDFDATKGREVFCPMRFIDGVPHVYWKYKFQWDTYDYDSGDFDHHVENEQSP